MSIGEFDFRIAFARAQSKIALVAGAAAIITIRWVDPDQRVSRPAASEMQQGNGPDAVPIPRNPEETEHVGP
ncbi:hypothetical protein [uncultured Bradyrhizobium sp.]|uniref:hypothetical protein n=1 Tax=uncultured Bradyrhizobium sp. TaxID=199684 RepID=UPI00262CAA64|nr:hypothetical protein [uncultured Bradyrhizobium sp.]